jgi:hypothetical protein
MAIAISLIHLGVAALAYYLFPGLWLDLLLFLESLANIPSVYPPPDLAI